MQKCRSSLFSLEKAPFLLTRLLRLACLHFPGAGKNHVYIFSEQARSRGRTTPHGCAWSCRKTGRRLEFQFVAPFKARVPMFLIVRCGGNGRPGAQTLQKRDIGSLTQSHKSPGIVTHVLYSSYINIRVSMTVTFEDNSHHRGPRRPGIRSWTCSP